MSNCLRIGRLHIHAHRWLPSCFDTCDVGNGLEVLVDVGPLTFYWTGKHNYDIGCGNGPEFKGGVAREGD